MHFMKSQNDIPWTKSPMVNKDQRSSEFLDTNSYTN